MSSETPTVETLLQHADFVRGLARNLLGSHPAAEDVAQDAFAAALERRPRSARSWFGRVVRNRVASVHRRDGARRRWLGRQTAGSAPDVSEILSREETRRRVVAALLALPEMYREPLVLRFYEDLPPRRIAARLELPVETVRTRIRRGLERLRTALDESFGERRAWQAALLPLVRSGAVPASTLAWIAAGAAACIAVALLTWSGVFRTSEPDPTSLLRAEADAKDTPVPTLAGRAVPEPAPVEPVAQPTRAWSVRGRVRWTETRTPAAGVQIEAWRVSGRAPRERLGRSTTDAEGRYEIPIHALAELGAGEIAVSELFLIPHGVRHADSWPPGETVRLPPIDRDAPELVLTQDLRVHDAKEGRGYLFGRLLDPDGRPVHAARIRLLRGEELVKRGRAVVGGVFDVPAGGPSRTARGGKASASRRRWTSSSTRASGARSA